MKNSIASSASISLRSMIVAILQASCLLLVVSTAQAQVVTDGSLGRVTSLSGTFLTIDPSLGQQRGSNLFHSFSTFNVGSAQWADFTNNVGTTNIIARITGGSASQINGLVTANANLFLLNPQGIIFGSGANINIAGSFHASTADYVRFTDGTRFYTNLGATTQLTTSAPTAFGFLRSTPSAISANNAHFTTGNSQSLSLIGGDISLTDSQLHASRGRVNLASASSTGEVVLGASTLDTTGITAKGNIHLNHAWINASGEEAANIYIRGGQFVMENSSSFVGITTAASGTRVVDIGVDTFQVRNSLLDFEPGSSSGGPATNVSISAKQFDVGNTSIIFAAGGGDLAISADDFRVSGFAIVGTGTAFAAKRAGNLIIKANTVTLDFGVLTALSGGDSDAGGVNVSADSINLRNGGSIFSTSNGGGTGGQVAITGHNLVVDGSNAAATGTTGISVASFGVNSNSGGAGKISVDVDSLTLRNAVISSSTFGPGVGGDVNLTARSFLMEQGTVVSSETGIAGPNGMPSSFGAGGAVKIDSTSMQILSGSRASASTYSNGAGGSVTVTANQLIIDQAGSTSPTGITASTGSVSISNATGSGGNLFLRVGDLQLHNQGLISTNTYGAGIAGRIDIVSDTLAVTQGAFVSASSFGQMTNAGGANDIVIQANKLNVGSFGQITNSTSGTGGAGRLLITAKELNIFDGGLLQASSLSNGANPGAVGAIFINSDTATMNAASINARSVGATVPGGIVINTRLLTLDHGAVVSATSGGTGSAGNITLGVSDTLELANASRITTEALNGSGGNIHILANNDLIVRDSVISTSVLGPAANGGNINIDPVFTILDRSQIIARAVGGNGGNINISTQYLLQSANSVVDASSQVGISGRVEVIGVDVDLDADIAQLPADFLNAKQWLAKSCASRQGNDISQFTVNGRDGAFRSTSDLMASPMTFDLPSSTAAIQSSAANTWLAVYPPSLPLIPLRPECLQGPG